jgi:thioredoxin 1
MSAFAYLIVAIVGLFLLMQIIPLIRARQARGKAVPELDALLTDAQRGQPRLLVYFWSPACGMCRPMTPVIDKLAAEQANVVKVNVAETTELARRIGIMGTPSLALIEGGTVSKVMVGARSEHQIRALLAA